jgi:hypothetical protein
VAERHSEICIGRKFSNRSNSKVVVLEEEEEAVLRSIIHRHNSAHRDRLHLSWSARATRPSELVEMGVMEEEEEVGHRSQTMTFMLVLEEATCINSCLLSCFLAYLHRAKEIHVFYQSEVNYSLIIYKEWKKERRKQGRKELAQEGRKQKVRNKIRF